MSKEYGGMNISATAEQSLDRPFVEILSKIFEAELSDEPEALNNLAWSLQALGTMTLDPEAGTAVKELNDLTHKVHSLINAHLDNEISAMQTRDDDTINNLRDYSRDAISRVNRVISRYIIKIVTFSFTNGPMQGCTIKNTSKLSFNTKDEFNNALRSVVDELVTLGFIDVAIALTTGERIEKPEHKEPSRCPIRRGSMCPTRYAGPTESDRLEIFSRYSGPVAESMWDAKVKQYENSRTGKRFGHVQ